MRKLIFTAALLCVWTLPVNAQTEQKCCQFGTPYDAKTTAEMPSCNEVVLAFLCTGRGGKLVSGSCHSDGICGGSKTCCGGVTIHQACTEPGNGHVQIGTAEYDSCAEVTEDACDVLSPTGVPTTQTFPGGVCEEAVCIPPCGGCQSGETCCSSGCADLSSDPNNCGSCGHVCPFGFCVGGTCQRLQ